MNKNLISKVSIKTLIIVTLLSCFGCSSEKSPQWQPLFNGEDLENWQVKITDHELNNNFGNTFRVEDGLLKVSYDNYDDGFNEQFGHLFYEEPFSSYLIGVEYRFVGDQAANNPGSWALRNSGIMVHGQEPETMEQDQDFPNSIEVQLLGGNGTDDRPTANLCTPGTQFVKDGEIIKQHCTNSSSPTFHGDQWVRVEVLVLGDSSITHYVNGEEVMQYQDPQTDTGELLYKGTISLQSESHPVEFREVEIINLEEYKDDPEKLEAVIEKLMAQKRVAEQ
jgi:hypothetical protein